MRHRVAHRKLGRVTEHRIALLRNQAEALLRHERIQTTVPKAKELKMFVEKIITTAKQGLSGDGNGNGKALHARRLVARDIQNNEIVKKLFTDLAPRFATRPGGYTRLLRIGFRRGDCAEMAQIELVGSEFNPKAAAEKKEAPEGKTGAKTVGGRLRAAAQRLRSRRGEKGEKAEEAEKPEKEPEEGEE
jgi:large subunit ribosomal protein L17